MVKENFGKSKTASAILASKHHSNVGGEVAEGKIFLHLLNGKKHMARYGKLEGDGRYFCRTCHTYLA